MKVGVERGAVCNDTAVNQRIRDTLDALWIKVDGGRRGSLSGISDEDIHLRVPLGFILCKDDRDMILEVISDDHDFLGQNIIYLNIAKLLSGHLLKTSAIIERIGKLLNKWYGDPGEWREQEKADEHGDNLVASPLPVLHVLL